jgi:hypothetical protein
MNEKRKKAHGRFEPERGSILSEKETIEKDKVPDEILPKLSRVTMPESLNDLVGEPVKLTTTDGKDFYYGIYRGHEVMTDRLRTRAYLQLETSPTPRPIAALMGNVLLA